MASALVGAVMGSAAGGLLTYLIAMYQWQNLQRANSVQMQQQHAHHVEQLERQHQVHLEVLKHERAMLADTFRHNYDLQAKNRERDLRHRMLSELYDVIDTKAKPAFDLLYQASNNWRADLTSPTWATAVHGTAPTDEGRSELSEAFRAIKGVCDRYRYVLPPGLEDQMLRGQDAFFEPIQAYKNAVVEAFESRQELEVVAQLIDVQANAMRAAIGQLGAWVEEKRDLLAKLQREVVEPVPPAG